MVSVNKHHDFSKTKQSKEHTVVIYILRSCCSHSSYFYKVALELFTKDIPMETIDQGLHILSLAYLSLGLKPRADLKDAGRMPLMCPRLILTESGV